MRKIRNRGYRTIKTYLPKKNLKKEERKSVVKHQITNFGMVFVVGE
jgi:hypothetical protein